MSPSHLSLHRRLLKSVVKFICETCLVYFLLSILALKFVSSENHCNRITFASINLTRWIGGSLTFRLVNLHSQISSWGPSPSYGEENASCLIKGSFGLMNEKGFVSPVAIRQVPGDGSCLFHAIAAGLLCQPLVEKNNTAVTPDDFDISDLSCDTATFPSLRQLHSPQMYELLRLSSELRQQAVDTLQNSFDEQSLLHLNSNQTIRASELIKSATQQYKGLTATEYLQDMQQYGVWGGGPEIVALANAMGRQIILLEPLDDDVGDGENRLAAYASRGDGIDDATCYLKVAAQFGKRLGVNEDSDVRVNTSASGDIFILLANKDFPNMVGRGYYAGIDNCNKNHFLAVFPLYDYFEL
ncbi:hypothetical protein ACHAXS_001151 [Conticribra weissflogii]